ncbi:MAG: hypothetical protein GY866_43495, partial [Proteobacteria bacterium]|nr:hypothetical protein [Pseudomonadota bacterium]
MEKDQNIALLLKQQLQIIYDRLKIEKHDTDKNKLKYLEKIARICSATLVTADVDEMT